MKKYLIALITVFVLLLSFSNTATAQREKGKTAKEQMKDQKEMKEARKQKQEDALQMKRERHKKIQDKKTRKRMKRTRKKSERYSSGKRLPFWKRWFRKRKF
jgi:Ni/Co efflux regulator RcnB